MSNELYRGIVDDRATGVFNGKVFVRRDAQQTNAYQSSQGVVLSDDAHHYSKPELEIYADDVKCSHGSTTGELEPEHVFYLRSRGLERAAGEVAPALRLRPRHRHRAAARGDPRVPRRHHRTAVERLT